MVKHKEDPPKGYRYVFCRYRKDPKTGKVLDARVYGYKAWRLLVKA